MKKAIKLCAVFAFLLLIFSGCNKNHTQKTIYRAVTEIDIVTHHRDRLVHRHYTDPQKMRPVLLYLRLIKPYGNPTKLSEEPKNVFLIAVSLSDGQTHYYRQAQHQYFSAGMGDWRKIDPAAAGKLYKLMADMPSDL